ncbi:hypothetical protein NQ315_001304 [Exocentrus adspersus]|uniref:Uncharacterized protein n=1 Tax=Exocentrus adspersus TaxID=1586481 RepID=A0AAV8WFJ4_9CUCU|nr:hypothetical protein NQ315_001304 [Exocentrus adspersus]
MLARTIIFLLPLLVAQVSADKYHVRISTDDPIVKGGTIRFVATVYELSDGKQIVSDDTDFMFVWEDNAIPQHTRQVEAENATDSWSVTYDADTYPVGTYIVNVVVKRCIIVHVVCYEVTSARSYFDITETLNGKMLLLQNNNSIDTEFVSNASTVTHSIQVKETDKEYIDKATTILTYWFVDCTYYGISSDFNFTFNYTVPEEEHEVEALVMADFTPLPPTTTTTTTPPSTTTTTSKPTTHAPNVTTTVRPTGSTATTIRTGAVTKTLIKRDVASYNSSFPFVCNGTQVATDSKKSYGHFYRKIHVKAPISKVNVTGNNWIQHGDLLSLNVQCQGSRNIEYCVHYIYGAYNVTGNETCYAYISLDMCDFLIKRYLPGAKYTVLIIIRNEVSKVVQPVTVTMYEVTKQPQLSVIVVPVAFSLVAVVLIVFGIAYYIQNRSRFVIEVADFNFGQQYADMEYKTFRERLRDSITNAITRGPTPSSSEVPVWPPGRKYGSMT